MVVVEALLKTPAECLDMLTNIHSHASRSLAAASFC